MAKAKGSFKPEDLKKYAFWVVLPLIVVLALVFTFLAKGKIKKDYQAITEAITAAKKGVDDVASNTKHPNDNTIKAIKAETGVLSDNVYNAWELMYHDQKVRNRWPRQLSREFLDLVENKLKWKDPIGVGKPYLLEDYGFFIANHLPDLLVEMNRRRCQVKEYKLLKKNEMSLLGIQGLEERFWPVYVSTDADGNKITYVAIYSDLENEKSPITDVFLYDVKKDLVSVVEDSQLRDELKAITDPEPYYLDVDPWILNPKDMIMYGVNDSQLQSIMQAISSAGSEGGAGGGMMGGGMMSGGLSGGLSGGGMGGGVSGGGAGARGTMGGSGSGMGGMEGGMSGGLAGLGVGAVPGDGYDPALEQVAGTSLEELAGGMSGATTGGAGGMTGGRTGGMTGMTGGMTGGMAGGGRTGGMTGGVSGGMGRTGGMGGGMDGGATNVEDPSWSQKFFPGLPPYKERRRIVGNVDWPDPEIYTLPTWEMTANPTSIEVWYAQETLWVYEALLRVVAATNSAKEEYIDNIAKAPVKCIEQLLIGQNAAIEFTTLSQTIGDLTGKSATAGALGSVSGDMTGMMGSGSSSGAGPMGAGGMGGEASLLSGTAENQALTKLIIGRYVGDKDDKKDQPLMADDKPPFAEFNKMPVCLKVAIDQRKIPELLASCANSTMPIDVRHIRICPDNNVPFVMPIPLENQTMGSGGMDMMGGMGAMGSMGGGMMGGGMGGGSGSGMGGNSRGSMNGAGGGMGGDMTGGLGGGMGGVEIGRSELSQSEYGPDAIRVEIYGVINIYNEPNKENFATGASAEEADAEAQAIIDNAQGDATTAEGDENATAPAEPATTDAATESAPAPTETPAPSDEAAPADTTAPADAT